jgi:hypothetical protein
MAWFAASEKAWFAPERRGSAQRIFDHVLFDPIIEVRPSRSRWPGPSASILQIPLHAHNHFIAHDIEVNITRLNFRHHFSNMETKRKLQEALFCPDDFTLDAGQPI